MFCCLRMCPNGTGLRKTTTVTNRFKEPEVHLDAAHMGPDVILLSNNLRITGSGGALATAPLVQSKSYFEVKIQQGGSWSVGIATQQADLTNLFGGCDKESWCLCSDNATRHNGEEYRPVVAVTTREPTKSPVVSESGFVGIEDILNDDGQLMNGDSDKKKGESALKETDNDLGTTALTHLYPDEGDIIGIAFDHVELNFYFNGKNLEVPFRNVKGQALYPVVFVGNGSILDIVLDNFQYGPPAGFDGIMLEQSLL